MTNGRTHRCASPICPGYAYPASRIPHPSSCVGREAAIVAIRAHGALVKVAEAAAEIASLRTQARAALALTRRRGS